MLVKLKDDLIVDTLNLKILGFNAAGVVEKQIDLGAGDEQSSDNKPIKEISPKFITHYETQQNIYILFYNPKYENINDKIHLVVINKQNWGVRKYRFENIIGGDLQSLITGNNFIEDYFIEFLGVFEKTTEPQDNTEETFIMFIVRADYRNTTNQKFNVGRLGVINIKPSGAPTISLLVLFNQSSITGSYEIVQNPNISGSVSLTILTELTTNEIIKVLNNMFARIQNTIYVKDSSDNTVKKHRIEYDIKRISQVVTHSILAVSRVIDSFLSGVAVEKIKNRSVRGGSRIVECVNEIQNWNTTNTNVIDTIIEPIKTGGTERYKIFNILTYRDAQKPTQAPANSLLYRAIKTSSNTKVILPYNSILTISPDGLNKLRWGGYITIYQVQKSRNSLKTEYLIIDKVIRWVRNQENIDVVIKEGAQQIIIIFNKPNDYVEAMIANGILENLPQEKQTRIINSAINWNINEIIFNLSYRTKSQNASLRNAILKFDENGLTLVENNRSLGASDTIEFLESTIGGQIKGYKRLYDLKFKEAIANLTPPQNNQKYKGVYNLKGVVEIQKTALPSNMTTDSKLYLFNLTVDNQAINTNGVTTQPQNILKIQNGRIVIDPPGVPSNITRKIRIKDIDIKLLIQTSQRHLRHSIDYISYEANTIRATFADVENHQDLNFKFTENISVINYDKIIVDIYFEIIYEFQGTNVIYNADGVDYVFKGSTSQNEERHNIEITRKADIGDETNFVKPSKKADVYYYPLSSKIAVVRNRYFGISLLKEIKINKPYTTKIKEVALGDNTVLLLYRKKNFIYYYFDRRGQERVGVDAGTRVFVRQQNEYAPTLTTQDATYNQELSMFVFNYTSQLPQTHIYGQQSEQDRHLLETQIMGFDLVDMGLNKQIKLVKENKNVLVLERMPQGSGLEAKRGVFIRTHYEATNEDAIKTKNININLPNRIDVIIRRIQMVNKDVVQQDVRTEDERTMAYLNTNEISFHLLNTKLLNSINNIITQYIIKKDNRVEDKITITGNTVFFDVIKSLKVNVKENTNENTNLNDDEYPIESVWTQLVNIANTDWTPADLNTEFIELLGSNLYTQTEPPVSYEFSTQNQIKTIKVEGYWIKQNIIPLIFLHLIGILKSDNTVTYRRYSENVNNPSTSRIYRQLRSKVRVYGLAFDKIEVQEGIKLGHIQATYTNRSIGDVNRAKTRIIERKYAI